MALATQYERYATSRRKVAQPLLLSRRVRALVMDNLSTSGRGGSGLRETAAEWFRNNQKTARAPAGRALEILETSTVRRGGRTRFPLAMGSKHACVVSNKNALRRAQALIGGAIIGSVLGLLAAGAAVAAAGGAKSARSSR